MVSLEFLEVTANCVWGSMSTSLASGKLEEIFFIFSMEESFGLSASFSESMPMFWSFSMEMEVLFSFLTMMVLDKTGPRCVNFGEHPDELWLGMFSGCYDSV